MAIATGCYSIEFEQFEQFEQFRQFRQFRQFEQFLRLNTHFYFLPVFFLFEHFGTVKTENYF